MGVGGLPFAHPGRLPLVAGYQNLGMRGGGVLTVDVAGREELFEMVGKERIPGVVDACQVFEFVGKGGHPSLAISSCTCSSRPWCAVIG